MATPTSSTMTVAGRWYVTAIDGTDNSKECWPSPTTPTRSTDSCPVYAFPLSAAGDLADFAKFGYNADAIVDRGQRLRRRPLGRDRHRQGPGSGRHAGQLPVDAVVQLPGPDAGPDARRDPGDPMWFMASTGDPTLRRHHAEHDPRHQDGPTSCRTRRPTPTTRSSVNTYGPNSGAADQPGAPGSVATNDVDDYPGRLPQRHAGHGLHAPAPRPTASGPPRPTGTRLTSPAARRLWFKKARRSGSGRGDLLPVGRHGRRRQHRPHLHGVVVDRVHLGLRGRHIAGHAAGDRPPPARRCPGDELDAGVSFRNGDYSTVVLDPADGMTSGRPTSTAGPDSGSNIWHTKIASFTLFSGVGTDYYSVNANAGDHLHFATSTPAGGPNEFVNNLYPELLLYDPNGNLVAIATGNAADGRNSVIDFTVPEGDAGKWTIEVTPSPNTAKPTQGEYGLLVTGATGALAPFIVTSTIPADGALVQPPTDYIVTFSQPVLRDVADPGRARRSTACPPSAVTLVDAHTVDWTLDPAYIVDRQPRAQHGGHLGRSRYWPASRGRQRHQLADFTSTFTTDNVAPTSSARRSRWRGLLAGPGRRHRGRHLQRADGHLVHHGVELRPLRQLPQPAHRGRVV